jgi:hypothetical protein
MPHNTAKTTVVARVISRLAAKWREQRKAAGWAKAKACIARSFIRGNPRHPCSKTPASQ